ncbi:MAG: hypothetical protein GF329_03115 [Candidatus Lokiarchaeota archaeon]|nr:hypothetical protein [Candidatus Lokiarchaeota archaeon]
MTNIYIINEKTHNNIKDDLYTSFQVIINNIKFITFNKYIKRPIEGYKVADSKCNFSSVINIFTFIIGRGNLNE